MKNIKFKLGSALSVLGLALCVAFLDDLIVVALIEEFGFEEKIAMSRGIPYALLIMLGLRLMDKNKEL